MNHSISNTKSGLNEIGGETDGEGEDYLCHGDPALQALPQESLMVERKIRIILLMQGLYNVRHLDLQVLLDMLRAEAATALLASSPLWQFSLLYIEKDGGRFFQR